MYTELANSEIGIKKACIQSNSEIKCACAITKRT